MEMTYLTDFENAEVAYIPIGTLEWHGHHLPIETDMLIAKKVCEEVAEEIPGIVFPPFCIATDVKKGNLVGMEIGVGKKLPGNIFFTETEIMEKLYLSLGKYLDKFKKIFLITGHGGEKHVETLEEVAKKNPKMVVIRPSARADIHMKHGADLETSYFWACYPKEEKRSRDLNIPKDDDYFVYRGFDPREKASIEIGQDILKKIVASARKSVKEEIGI